VRYQQGTFEYANHQYQVSWQLRNNYDEMITFEYEIIGVTEKGEQQVAPWLRLTLKPGEQSSTRGMWAIVQRIKGARARFVKNQVEKSIPGSQDPGGSATSSRSPTPTPGLQPSTPDPKMTVRDPAGKTAVVNPSLLRQDEDRKYRIGQEIDPGAIDRTKPSGRSTMDSPEAARRRAAEAQQRYQAAMASAAAHESKARTSLASGQGDATNETLQAQLDRMRAQSEIRGYSGTASQIASKQAQLAEQSRLISDSVGTVGNLITGIWTKSMEEDERREQAQADAEERRLQRELARQEQEADAAEEQARVAELQRQANEALASAREEERRAKHLEIAATLKTDSSPSSAPTTVSLKPVDRSAARPASRLALKPVASAPSTFAASVPKLKPMDAVDPSDPRVDRQRYLRIFLEGDCPVKSLRPVGWILKKWVFNEIPLGLRSVEISSDCTGIVQLFVGRQLQPEGYGIISKNIPMTVPVR